MNAIVSDIDPQETKEWIEAIQSVVDREGAERAHQSAHLENLKGKA